jgi:hypothetical protein
MRSPLKALYNYPQPLVCSFKAPAQIPGEHTARLQFEIFHMKNRVRYRELCICMMHNANGISFDKILPKQVGYFGTRIN